MGAIIEGIMADGIKENISFTRLVILILEDKNIKEPRMQIVPTPRKKIFR
jgi:hypothetical protein